MVKLHFDWILQHHVDVLIESLIAKNIIITANLPWIFTFSSISHTSNRVFSLNIV
jgi:hypothetical protein